MPPSTEHPTPTIDNLRVKLCYNCREEKGLKGEEIHGEPEQAPSPHGRPLHWIQTAKRDPSGAANAITCSRCGAKYVVQSHQDPWLLRLTRQMEGMGMWTGRWYALGLTAGVTGVLGSRILTVYGAWAVRQFIGQEMFELVLPGNPTDWSWPNFLLLPVIPFSLVAARLSRNRHLVHLLPILLLWPYHPPERLYRVDLPKSVSLTFKETSRRSLLSIPPAWPPSPLDFGLLILPIIHNLYRKLFRKLENYVLGPEAIELAGDEGARTQLEDQRESEKNADAEDDPKIATENTKNIEAGLAVVVPANKDGRGRRQNVDLSQAIGGALLTPVIASLMGSVLYRLSEHIPTLKVFLGIRPGLISSLGKLAALGPAYGALANMSAESESANDPWVRLSADGIKETLGGIEESWVEADPVWWRNSVGLGVFVLTKDCIGLWYRWILQREMKSRHLRRNDIRGIEDLD